MQPAVDLEGESIRIADHCYGCTAGQGSSCGGALEESAASGTLAQATVVKLVPVSAA